MLQMDVIAGNPIANFLHANSMIEKALVEKPDVIILPEMWNTSYALTKIRELADQKGVPNAKGMGELACRHGVNVVAGSIADFREEKVYNTSYIYDRKGKEVARYDKVHLFGLMSEKTYLTAGNARRSFYLDGVKCGVMICYDLRFPELSRALALDGVRVLFISAQWPHPRQHPWRILLQARAIENQLFIVAVNRVGQEGETSFFGHSMVVNPLGEIMLEGSAEEEILTADLDLAKIEEVRSYMTCFSERVPEVYK